ncbi:MAG TPA: GNAT family N-acetyltransferase [Solirubrobacteraceae bacterium]|nr:GNAT family N-acetyltransferase [Solirubrobacteraceae bacterium]
MAELRTDRLLLRRWRAEDREPFAALNADPEVMRHFPAPLDRAHSDALAARAEAQITERGWGLWAVEVAEAGGGAPSAPFAGFIGLGIPSFEAHFTPVVEVGWRLARRFWGRGYATEGARAALAFAFDTLRLAEVVSFTAVGNERSRRVMERLGMTRDPEEDFDHPWLPGSTIERHVLYRLGAERYARSAARRGAGARPVIEQA